MREEKVDPGSKRDLRRKKADTENNGMKKEKRE